MLILGERYRDLLEAPLKRLTDDNIGSIVIDVVRA